MNEQQVERVRRFCLALPETSEKLSHGEPTFFVAGKVFVMFANNHHDDGRIAVWLPVPPGAQPALITSSPDTYFRPPYVGHRGWVGIESVSYTHLDVYKRQLQYTLAWLIQ